MASLLQRAGDCHLSGFCFLTGPERTNPLHQVVAQPNTEAMRFSCRERATGLVLLEPFFRRVRRLAHIKRGKGARASDASAVELYDVNRIDDRFRSPARTLLRLRHDTTYIGRLPRFLRGVLTPRHCQRGCRRPSRGRPPRIRKSLHGPRDRNLLNSASANRSRRPMGRQPTIHDIPRGSAGSEPVLSMR
jgi:hypothetical protein